MRKQCPICGSEPSRSFEMSFVVPSSWTLPANNKVCLCPKDGMIWYDNDCTQADYDQFYRERYGYGVDNPDNRMRLWGLASVINSAFADKSMDIIDIGGEDGYLADRLKELGFRNVAVANIGYSFGQEHDLIILSHVLEHVYDLDGFMDRVHSSLKSDGRIMVEIPEAYMYAMRNWPPILDYNQKHINHFSAFALDSMFAKYGYAKGLHNMLEYRPLNAPCYRALYLKDAFAKFHLAVQEHIERYDSAINAKLAEITEPVIIYGLGDLAWHILATNKLNVVGLADDDPAYRGCTIGGIEVTDNVKGHATILVMAQGQKQGVLDAIKKKGLNNKVIAL